MVVESDPHIRKLEEDFLGRAGYAVVFADHGESALVQALTSRRHEELLPLVEQAANESPGVVPFKLSYGIICATVGRDEVARARSAGR